MIITSRGLKMKNNNLYSDLKSIQDSFTVKQDFLLKDLDKLIAELKIIKDAFEDDEVYEDWGKSMFDQDGIIQ